jgi:hypothetical protein
MKGTADNPPFSSPNSIACSGLAAASLMSHAISSFISLKTLHNHTQPQIKAQYKSHAASHVPLDGVCVRTVGRCEKNSTPLGLYEPHELVGHVAVVGSPMYLQHSHVTHTYCKSWKTRTYRRVVNDDNRIFFAKPVVADEGPVAVPAQREIRGGKQVGIRLAQTQCRLQRRRSAHKILSLKILIHNARSTACT